MINASADFLVLGILSERLLRSHVLEEMINWENGDEDSKKRMGKNCLIFFFNHVMKIVKC